MLHFARVLLGAPTAPATLDTQTVTSGGSGANPNRVRGLTSGLGSISDGTSNLYSGAAISQLSWHENGGFGDDYVKFEVAGSQSNSGWSQMTIDGTTVLLRSDASFAIIGGISSWLWIGTGFGIGDQPFGGIGSTHSVVFT